MVHVLLVLFAYTCTDSGGNLEGVEKGKGSGVDEVMSLFIRDVNEMPKCVSTKNIQIANPVTITD